MEINFNEKVFSSASAYEVKLPEAGDSVIFEAIIPNVRDFRVSELFGDYRQFGLPTNPEHFYALENMKPVKVYTAGGTGESVFHNTVIFRQGEGKLFGLPVLTNSLGIKFQQEMVDHLNRKETALYLSKLTYALKALREERTLADVIKYATDDVPASRSTMSLLNKKVNEFWVISRPGQENVLGVNFKGQSREVTISLKKSKLSREQRRNFIDTKARQRVLTR